MPEMPAAAKENTPEGREAFIKYYFDLMNYTIEARDPQLMSNVTVEGSDYLDNLMSIAYYQGANKVWTVGGALTFKSVQLSPSADPYGAYTDIVVWDKAPYEYFQNAKNVLSDTGSNGRSWPIQTYYRNSGWVVQSLTDPES